jgi:hypothetical protein
LDDQLPPAGTPKWFLSRDALMYNINQPTYNDDVRSRIGDDPENQSHNHRIDYNSKMGTRQPNSSEMRTEPTTSRKLGQESGNLDRKVIAAAK